MAGIGRRKSSGRVLLLSGWGDKELEGRGMPVHSMPTMVINLSFLKACLGYEALAENHYRDNFHQLPTTSLDGNWYELSLLVIALV